jgi:hypothetical protein
MPDNDYIEVPIFHIHDMSGHPIGTMRVQKDRIPLDGNFNFEIGYTKNPDGTIMLREVSLCMTGTRFLGTTDSGIVLEYKK